MDNNITVVKHALVEHKVALLRDVNTGTKQFREVVEEITTLLACEALRDVPTREVVVHSPLERVAQNMLADDAVILVPILRAGLGMVNGVLAILPTGKVGHVGLCRDEETLQPKQYYCNLPQGVESGEVVVLDPMLATGGSASAAIDLLKARGATRIKLIVIFAAPCGLERIVRDHPDVKIYCAVVDRCLNENGYILPGLGDAGDRVFGTK